MTIGEVAMATGLRASAIRYYERAGLLPKPLRTFGQRRYDDAIFDRLAVLERAKACGFTLAEIAILFNDAGTHSVKWQRIAQRKIAELDRALERIGAMKDLLTRRCQCATADECGRRIRQSRKHDQGTRQSSESVRRAIPVVERKRHRSDSGPGRT